MIDLIKNVMSIIGKLFATSGISIAIALGIFKWLGKNWIEQKFKAQLESLRHEQQKEIENLRQVMAYISILFYLQYFYKSRES